MLIAPIPASDHSRLQDLHSYNILDTPEEREFNDLAELVAEICACPISCITFVDQYRLWFKATRNLLEKECSRTNSICGHTILSHEVLVVTDASKDPRFFDNPNVTGPLKISFYAGAPILSSSGFALGTVCTMDRSPRILTPGQIKSLVTIARQVSLLLDLRLKNKEVADTAASLIQAEKQIAQINIKSREEQNFKTANLLREDIAQSTAAVKLYMNFAKNSKGVSGQFLDGGITELEKLVKSITRLSRSITPTTVARDNYAAHIEKLAHDFARDRAVTLQFGCEADQGYLTGHKGLLMFRIVEDMLRIANYSGSTSVSLNISSEGGLALRFTFNETKKISTAERVMLDSNIATKVAILRGDMQNKDDLPGRQHFIQITFAAAFKKMNPAENAAKPSDRSGL